MAVTSGSDLIKALERSAIRRTGKDLEKILACVDEKEFTDAEPINEKDFGLMMGTSTKSEAPPGNLMDLVYSRAAVGEMPTMDDLKAMVEMEGGQQDKVDEIDRQKETLSTIAENAKWRL